MIELRFEHSLEPIVFRDTDDNELNWYKRINPGENRDHSITGRDLVSDGFVNLKFNSKHLIAIKLLDNDEGKDTEDQHVEAERLLKASRT